MCIRDSIKSVVAQGYAYELQGRFSQPANYFLTYGNSNVRQPRYDLHQFMDKIPDGLNAVQVGHEQAIKSPETKEEVEPLIKNKLWLWIIMVSIICLLGWFTLSMMKQKESV